MNAAGRLRDEGVRLPPATRYAERAMLFAEKVRDASEFCEIGPHHVAQSRRRRRTRMHLACGQGVRAAARLSRRDTGPEPGRSAN
ncbi:MAG: hypothetical protein WKH64_12380 [Chloroflexia bacterium]